MIIVQNLLIYSGCYSIIAGIWRAYEYTIKKKITPNAKDTCAALGTALVIWLFFKI